ncbi:MAG: hypothetical protein QW794_05945 [Thermosphaera sp.]
MPRSSKPKSQSRTLLSFARSREKRKNPLILGRGDDVYEKYRARARSDEVKSRIRKVLRMILRKRLGVGRAKLTYSYVEIGKSKNTVYVQSVAGRMKLTLDLAKILNAKEDEIKKLKPKPVVVQYRFDYWIGKGFDMYIAGHRSIRNGRVDFTIHITETGMKTSYKLLKW